MTTRLDGELKREISICDTLYTLTLTPHNLVLALNHKPGRYVAF